MLYTIYYILYTIDSLPYILHILYTIYYRLTALLNNSDNLHSYLADRFYTIAPTIGQLVLELKESLYIYDDITYLRDKCILNPCHERNPVKEYDYSGYPTTKLNRTRSHAGSESNIPILPELMDGHNYHEYVVYSIILCPSLLYSNTYGPAIQEMVRRCLSMCLFVRIFRDVVCSIECYI